MAPGIDLDVANSPPVVVAGDGDLDFLREGVKAVARAVMKAEVPELAVVCHGFRDPERRPTRRDGGRKRRWDTLVDAIDLSIPRDFSIPRM